MANLDRGQTRRTIVDDFDVLNDDIHVKDDGSSLTFYTFYVPTDQLEQAKAVLDAEIKV